MFFFGALAAFAPLESGIKHEAEKQRPCTPCVPFVFTHVTNDGAVGQRQGVSLSPSIQRRKLRRKGLNNVKQMI